MPDHLLEVEHRARDIMFTDKTLHSIQMSRAVTQYLSLINDLYQMLEKQYKSKNKEDKEKFEKICARYKKIFEEHGAVIKAVHYITRTEPFPYLYENADFPVDAIKNSIKDGELKTAQIAVVVAIRIALSWSLSREVNRHSENIEKRLRGEELWGLEKSYIDIFTKTQKQHLQGPLITTYS